MSSDSEGWRCFSCRIRVTTGMPPLEGRGFARRLDQILAGSPPLQEEAEEAAVLEIRKALLERDYWVSEKGFDSVIAQDEGFSVYLSTWTRADGCPQLHRALLSARLHKGLSRWDPVVKVEVPVEAPSGTFVPLRFFGVE